MKGYVKASVVILVGLALLIPFASKYPDGLEKVAETLLVEEPYPMWQGLLPDYTFPIIEDSYFTTLISRIIGFFLVLGVAWVLGVVITRKTQCDAKQNKD